MNNLSRKIAQIKALKNDNGIYHLLNEAYKILGNPILIQDMSYKKVAHTENIITDDPLWNEFVETGCFSDESICFFKNEDFIDAVANTDNITFLISDKLKYDRIFGKIYNKDNITVANACMIFCDKTFEEDDKLIFEALCKKVSTEFSKIEYYQNYGKIYQETIIKKLIEASINDKALYAGHIANIYEGLKNNLYLAVVDTAQCGVKYDELAYFRDLFKKTQSSFKYFVYSNQIIILISSSAMKPNIKRYLNKFTGIFEQNNMHVGISSGFDNLFDLRKYYLEALSALDYGLKYNSARRLFLYDELIRNFPE